MSLDFVTVADTGTHGRAAVAVTPFYPPTVSVITPQGKGMNLS